MKKFQSYDQFEAEFREENIPEIDLEKLKARVNELGNQKQVVWNKRWVAVLITAVILAMCFGTVAMALYNGWQLKNNKGEVVYDYSKLENSEVFQWLDAAKAESKYGLIKEELRESLVPGELAYFLVTEAYEIDKLCSVMQVEDKIYNLEKLRESTTTKFKVPQYLPDSYQFEYGMIIFKEDGDKVKQAEALYQEAKKTGQDYITHKVMLTKKAELITLKYVNDDGYKLTIRIGDWDRSKSMTSDIDTIEKLTISNKEVLYIRSNPYKIDNYVFVDEDDSKKLTYYITNNGGNEVFFMDSDRTHIELSKEEAAKMIKSFK